MLDTRLDRTRIELADFLRHRREALSPLDVGLPIGKRRRTPGLRREEVAALAGVGLTWYTWLEQGREIKVSTAFLDNIARVLKLDEIERPSPAASHARSGLLRDAAARAPHHR